MTKLSVYCLSACCVILLSVFHSSLAQKYKLCVVDGKGLYKKSQSYCPLLDSSMDSTVECVVRQDRTDCLRQILKGNADFSLFYPEDLISANLQKIEVLVTNEVRYRPNDPYDYQVVAVVDNASGIKSRHDLKNKKYCHPGYGYETDDWSKILSNYFEGSVVTPSCDPNLTLQENRLLASSNFFGSSCKAGPWVNEAKIDQQLKRKYPKLCGLCGNPNQCSMRDEFWGRSGSLLCLTDGAGDISWARLDDVQAHFGLNNGIAQASSEGYSFLCPDDSIMPVNSSNPCVWVARPWPVVAARRAVADEIQQLVSILNQNDRGSWRYNLLNLLEPSYSTIFKLPTLEPIQTYLEKAKGFLSANSFSGCHPPRTIKICTKSLLEMNKCSWLRDSAAVYGIEPDLECVLAENTTQCLKAVYSNATDVVIVPADLVQTAIRTYKLKTFLYETVPDAMKHKIVAVTRAGSSISTLDDLKGKKACFPTYDGVAWNVVGKMLRDKKLIENCASDASMTNYFGPSCVPGISNTYQQSCQKDNFSGDLGALHCLTSETGDVAFVSQNSIADFLKMDREESMGRRLTMDNFTIICEKGSSPPCSLGWTTRAQVMIRANTADLWLRDTTDVFFQIDELFGKDFKTPTSPLMLFGLYDDKSDVLFDDSTRRLRTVPVSKDTESLGNFFNASSELRDECGPISVANRAFSSSVCLCILISALCKYFF
ncbi:unnamed protein product [Phyllotreta striolata]|uniref:Transferrin n=1 Tax=Phyllotreta striolata TaxID=444603 RepID=A0A9N9TWM0_PHYSR|nr:unnamed protein product [Phyllotreta striolata]